MLSYLLADAPNYSDYFTWGLVIVVAIALGLMLFFSSKKRKKQEQEAKDLIDAVKPGNKVKTIGGVCGIVVEVNSEENTFVLETGSETAGKSYVKFDRQAIYQTDAVVDKQTPAANTANEAPADGIAPEIKPSEVTEKKSEDEPVLVKSKKEKKKSSTEENNG